jgi:hypothetical protein
MGGTPFRLLRQTMLPPFIIEQIKKREEAEKTADNQPRLELPLPRPRVPVQHSIEEESNRGVIVLDI